jgi:hypothetical protein
MVRVAVALCVVEPEVTLKVSVCVPVESCELTVIVAVACSEPEPLSVTDAGETEQVAFEPSPLQDSETLPEKSTSELRVSV